MNRNPADPSHSFSSMSEEYQVLHEVAKALQTPQETEAMLKQVMAIITQFDELKVESKAGIFLADTEKQVLRLHTTIGDFSEEFLEKEKEVPYGSCLCGRAAVSGEVLTSDSCFTDPRHERTFKNMTAHGHYIIPLKSRDKLVGVLFLYTSTHPTWYQHSQEVLLSIGGLIADAIERKQVEEELARYRDHLEETVADRTQQLRMLSRHLESVREEEKTRIAREVHDGLGQSLTALKLDLAWMQRRLDKGREQVQDKIGDMNALLEETIERVQKISTELRPQILDVLGVCEALRWQTREFEKRSGTPCTLTILPEAFDLDPEISTALFRIYQETLTNVTRHANATEVRVRLEKGEASVELEVVDNGRGIEDHEISDVSSIGLMGIRERVLVWDGAVKITGRPGQGTTVRVRIPISKK